MVPGRTFIGRQQVVEGRFARIATEIDAFEIIRERFLSDGDEVAMIGRYGMGIASGKPLDAQVLHLWRVVDGKIVGFQQFADTRQLAEVFSP